MTSAAFLVRLYPPRWRARYGDELSAMLEDQPLTPRIIADVVVDAVSARCREQQWLQLLLPLAISISGGLLGRRLRAAMDMPFALMLIFVFWQVLFCVAVWRLIWQRKMARRAGLPMPAWSRRAVMAALTSSWLASIAWSWGAHPPAVFWLRWMDFYGPGFSIALVTLTLSSPQRLSLLWHGPNAQDQPPQFPLGLS